MDKSPGSGTSRRSVALALPFLLVLALPWGPPTLQADEIHDLIDALVAHRKAERIPELESLIDQVPQAYHASEAKMQAKLRSELGKVAKDKKLGAARVAAVGALVRLDDAKHAWKEVGKLLPKPKTEDATDLDLAVVRATGDLAQPKATKPLLELVAKAKDPKLAAAAARAIGGYKGHEKVRVKLLAEAVTLGRRLKPGQPAGGKAGSPDAQKRWELVGAALVQGLNELTGRDVQGFDAWVELWNEHKKSPKDLFPS